MVSVCCYTDPACPWSWGVEPSIRKLMVQFGDALDWTFVMGGLARDVKQMGPSSGGEQQVYGRLVREWLEAAERSGMPFDPLLWWENPIATSYPACMAVAAAAEQAPDSGYGYLRRLREGLMCERRKLDHLEALVAEARGVGLDAERFRLALRSHAIAESFAADLDRAGALAAGATPAGPDSAAAGRGSRTAGGALLPTLVFRSPGGDEHAVAGFATFDAYRAAAQAAGARPSRDGPPAVIELLQRFGRAATVEVAVVCELPGPRAGAELFRLAEQWRVRPVWRMTGHMWEAA